MAFSLNLRSLLFSALMWNLLNCEISSIVSFVDFDVFSFSHFVAVYNYQ